VLFDYTFLPLMAINVHVRAVLTLIAVAETDCCCSEGEGGRVCPKRRICVQDHVTSHPCRPRP